MKYCKKCVMPDTRPGIRFDENGVCYPCLAAEKKKTIDWNKRLKELEELCSRYKGANGNYYDCAIAVSSGKDSHFQVHMMKNVMKMNPLLLSVGSNLSLTEAGMHNFFNIRDVFDCDCIVLHLSPNTTRKMFRKAFEKFGSPAWYWDRAVYVYPIRMAINMKIPLLVYGENISYEYGGPSAEDAPSALGQIENSVAKSYDWDEWLKGGDITMKELNAMAYPTIDEIKEAKLDPIYLSYFVPWDGYKDMELAKTYGFKSLNDTGEWKRQGYIEDYDQIDDIGYLVHPWMKYPKYGHSRTTDVACYWIRTGRITREEGINFVKQHDHKLDPKALKDFLNFTGYSEEEFWKIVDKHYNREIFEKIDGRWQLKTDLSYAL